MCRRTGPAPSFGRGDQPCAHRVQFDVADGSDKVVLIERKRVKALLPEMTAPAVAKIDDAGVAAMSVGEGAAEATRIRGHENEVHVVRHQAVGEHLDAGAAAAARDPRQVGEIARRRRKSLQTPVATWVTWWATPGNDDAGVTGHASD